MSPDAGNSTEASNSTVTNSTDAFNATEATSLMTFSTNVEPASNSYSYAISAFSGIMFVGAAVFLTNKNKKTQDNDFV